MGSEVGVKCGVKYVRSEVGVNYAGGEVWGGVGVKWEVKYLGSEVHRERKRE